MKTIKVQQRRIFYSYANYVAYNVGIITVCTVQASQTLAGKWLVLSSILSVSKLFLSQEDAENYCKNYLIPEFLIMLQHGV